ncbi:hypothetical protein [Deinococcus aestuarii]|uniref:hypothetical protein n=1 Tax=Deinococcus aestuarii TaxID=2774531 RepID=UPI001C0A9529|nr:hypothetical protein [Deinococcus aestuarii]
MGRTESILIAVLSLVLSLALLFAGQLRAWVMGPAAPVESVDTGVISAPAAPPRPRPVPPVPTRLPPPPARSPDVTAPSANRVIPDAGPLERGRRLTRLFYDGNLEQVWAAFSPSARGEWGGLAGFETYRESGRRAYGAETGVVRERVVREGELTYYTRTATFEKGPRGGWTVVFGLDASGRVQEFGIVAP